MNATLMLKSLLKDFLRNRQKWGSTQPDLITIVEHHPVDSSLDSGPIHQIKTYNDVIIWPGQSIAANRDGKIAETLVFDDWRAYVDRYLLNWPIRRISTPCTSTDFVWSGQNHFHQMLDCNSRLMALRQIEPIPGLKLLLPNTFSQKYIPLIKLICPWVEPLLVPNYLRFRCKTYLHLPPISTPLRRGESNGVGKFSGLSPEFFHLHQKFISHVPVKKKKLVYISREGAGHRRILNEAQVSSLITQNGGIVLRMENMTIEEQLVIFRDSRVIVSPHGAAMANLLATHGETTYVELLPCKVEHAPDYFGPVGTSFFDHIVLDGEASGIHDDFHVDLYQLKDILTRLL